MGRSAGSYRRVQRIAHKASVSLLGYVPEPEVPLGLPPPLRGSAPSTIDKGTWSEGAVLVALLRLGYNVLIPFGVARYDLVIETAAGFKRVQCKTGQKVGGVLVVSTISKGKRYVGDVDYFGVHDIASGCVYMVPFEAVGNRRVMHLRLDGKPGGRDAKLFQIA